VSASKKRYLFTFSLKAKDDYQYFEKHSPKSLFRIAKLLEAIAENPYEGIGKPKQLGHHFSGAWSRRVDTRHRIVYAVENGQVFVISLRGHYADK
jgi:toxin YoeB